MQVLVVVGNPKPMSRTRTVAEAVAERVMAAAHADSVRTIDLCDYADDLFRWPDDELSALNAGVAASDYVVFASPTYKAAYTGLLKAFLDRYETNGLAGVTAIPVMTGGSPSHSMAVEMTLRPLLVELGASTPTRGLYFVMSELEALDQKVDEWARGNAAVLATFGQTAR